MNMAKLSAVFFKSFSSKVPGEDGYRSGFGFANEYYVEVQDELDFFSKYGGKYPDSKFVCFERDTLTRTVKRDLWEKTKKGWLPVVRPDENAGEEPYLVILCSGCGYRYNPGEQIRPAEFCDYKLAFRMTKLWHEKVFPNNCPQCGWGETPVLRRWTGGAIEKIPGGWNQVDLPPAPIPERMTKEEVVLLRLHNHGTFQQGRSNKASTFIKASGGWGLVDSAKAKSSLKVEFQKIFGSRCVHVKVCEGPDRRGWGGGSVIELILTEPPADLETRVETARKKRYETTIIVDQGDGTYEVVRFAAPGDPQRKYRVEAVRYLRWRRKTDGQAATRWIDPRGDHPGIMPTKEYTAVTEAQWAEVGIYIDDPKYLRLTVSEFQEIV